MYIPPVWVGVMATISAEIIALIVTAVIFNIKGNKK